MKEDIILCPLTAGDVTAGYVGWLNDSAIRRYLGIRHRSGFFDKEEVIAAERNDFFSICILEWTEDYLRKGKTVNV